MQNTALKCDGILSGDTVKTLQHFLNTRGGKKIAVDGQIKDGSFTDETLESLKSLLNEFRHRQARANAKVQYDILGQKVLSIKQVKKLPDGFGTATIRAMQAFLSANGSYCFGSGKFDKDTIVSLQACLNLKVGQCANVEHTA